jgi:transposase
MRCLKRRISDALFRQLVADANAAMAVDAHAGPGGHRGASLNSSAAGSHPHTGTSDQPLPGPAPTTLPAPTSTRKSTISSPLQPDS